MDPDIPVGQLGDYAFRALVPGNYELKVGRFGSGWKTEVRTGLKLDPGKTYRIDMELTPSKVGQWIGNVIALLIIVGMYVGLGMISC